MVLSESNSLHHRVLNAEEEKLFNRLKSDYSCGICLSILQGAVTTPCGHLFCFSCLQKWAQSVFPDVICPKCRKPFRMENTIRMYNSSSDNTKRMRLSNSQIKKLAPKLVLQCRKLGNIMIFEADFTDPISLKSMLYILIAFTITLWLLMIILDSSS